MKYKYIGTIIIIRNGIFLAKLKSIYCNTYSKKLLK